MDGSKALFLGMTLSLVVSLGSGAPSHSTDAKAIGTSSDRAFPLQAIVRASDAQEDDHFGVFVALSGDVAIVGAPREDGGLGDPIDSAGAAYVFRRDKDGASQWGQVQKLTASDAQVDDRFGHPVALSGDVAIVGAGYEDGGLGDPMLDAGAAYVFRRDKGGPSNWGQVAKLTAPDAQTLDRFGSSVAIDGNTAIIGAYGEDGGPADPTSNAGVAYVFQTVEGLGWVYLKTLRASDAQSEDNFGFSVAISGDVVIVGASGEDGGPGDHLSGAGAAYIYSRNHGGDNQWGEVTKLVTSDPGASDYFGHSVAVSGKLALVAAYMEDGGPGDPLPGAGAAYLFANLSGFGWTQIRKLTAADASAHDHLGVSVAILGDVAIVGAVHEGGGPGNPLPNAGAAYVFMRHFGGSGTWGQTRKLLAPDAQASDYFGQRVAVSGSSVIVGASSEDGGGGDPTTNAGAAYIYYVSLLEAFKAN